LVPSYDYVVVGEVSRDTRNLEVVCRTSRVSLTRLACLRVGDRDEAEDVVQWRVDTAHNDGPDDRRPCGDGRRRLAILTDRANPARAFGAALVSEVLAVAVRRTVVMAPTARSGRALSMPIGARLRRRVTRFCVVFRCVATTSGRVQLARHAELGAMRLEPLYRMTFGYPHGWSVALAGEGTEGQHLFLADGRCEGRLSGLMQGANHPRRRGDGTFCPDFHGVISTDDGATVLFDCGGYGRAYPADAREIVCWLTHVSDDSRYRWLNDVVCVGTGEVRPDQLLIDVAELVWEPPGAVTAGT
jgi:hypothetical protein